jgi:hypothetical protein
MKSQEEDVVSGIALPVAGKFTALRLRRAALLCAEARSYTGTLVESLTEFHLEFASQRGTPVIGRSVLAARQQFEASGNHIQ